MTIQPLKNKFPFRLGTTSYILPAGYADNVAFLGPLVDDVELLFFESSGVKYLPEKAEVRRLGQLKIEYDLSYTLHLPLDLRPGSGDESVRGKSMEPCRRLVSATAGLEPLAWILHVPAEIPGHRVEWHIESLERSIETLREEGLDRTKLCLETLDYPCEQIRAMAEEHDLSICIDIGHLLRYGFSVERGLEACLKRSRILHLHGLQERKDHQDISYLEPELIRKVVDTLTAFGSQEAVLTLEVFGREDFYNSLHTLREYLP